MSEPRKAERYAQAILDAIVEQWQTVLMAVADALVRSPDLLATLENSRTGLDERLQALAEIVPQGVSPEMQNFLKMLVQEGDVELVAHVASALETSLRGEIGPQEAEIVSAVELSETEKEKLRSRLIAEHGEALVFHFRVDPSLMGGLRIRVGDKLIDYTVASRLTALRDMIAATVR